MSLFLHLQIFDCSGWANTLSAELFVPLPEASMVTGTVEVEPFEFSSDHFVTYKHSGIGSGKYCKVLIGVIPLLLASIGLQALNVLI